MLDKLRICVDTVYMHTHPLRRSALADELVAEIAKARVTKSSVAQAAGISVDTLRRRLSAGHHAPFPTEDVVAICGFLGVDYRQVIERAREAA